MTSLGAVLTFQVVTSFSEIENGQAEWDAFAASCGAPIYMSFDWLRTWWEFYGGRRRLAVFRILADGELAGFLPMYIDRLGFGPVRITMARLVGAAEGPTRVFDPPLRSDVAAWAVKTVVETLLRERMCDFVSFGPVRSSYHGTKDLASLLDSRIYRLKSRLVGPLTYFDLSDRPKDYLETLGGAEQRKRRHDFRYLAKLGAKVSVITGPEAGIEKEFREFARLHAAFWETKGRPGHFRAWPRAYDYHLALAKQLGRRGWLRLLKIATEEGAILYDYNYAFGPSYYGELRARTLDETWSKISLGNCALISALRSAVSEGATAMYVGVGHNEYEARLGALECPAVAATILRKAWRVRIRAAVFSFAYTLIEVFYFKIWYMRLQPRMPRRFRRPIWKFWARISI